MDENRQRDGATHIQGNLLRLSERREIAIYFRDGVPWVADFNNGRGALYIASAWYGTGGGRMLAHAQRRGEVETVSPLPDALVRRIESLHRRMKAPIVGPAVRRMLVAMLAVFRDPRSPVQPY